MIDHLMIVEMEICKRSGQSVPDRVEFSQSSIKDDEELKMSTILMQDGDDDEMTTMMARHQSEPVKYSPHPDIKKIKIIG